MRPKFSFAVLALSCSFGHAMADEALSVIPAPILFSELAAKCAPKVNHQTLNALVGNESTYNPYAIGVVDGVLERQPRSRNEAIATAARLEQEGYNFSVGIGQFNIKNIRAMGLTVDELFDPCRNLQVSSELLVGYYTDVLASTPNKQVALRKALSRYYSGNDRRGFEPDKPGEPSYVQKVVNRALDPNQVDPVVPALEATESDEAIPVADTSTSSHNRALRARRASQAKNEQWVMVTVAPSEKQPSAPPTAFDKPEGDAGAAESESAHMNKQSVQVTLNTGAESADERVAEFHRPKASVSQTTRESNQQPSVPSFVQIIN